MAENIDVKLSLDSRQAQQNIQRFQGAVNGLKASLAGLAGIGTVATLGKISDEVTELKNRLTVLTDSQQASNKLFKDLVQVANNSRTSLTSVGDLYFRIAKSADTLGISQQQALDVTDTVSKAITASGISAAEASGPLLQLGQALQSGRLQGDELRSILEGMPPVARALADSLGVPIGALKELGAAGVISSRDVIRALQQARDSIEQDFSQTAPTIGQSFIVLKNNFSEFISEVDRAGGFSKAVTDAILSIADSLKKFAKDAEAIRSFVDTLKTIFEWAVIIGSFFAGGLIARGLALVARGFSNLASYSEVAGRVIARFFSQTKVFNSLGVGRFIDKAGNKVYNLGTTINKAGKEVLTFVRGPAALFLNWLDRSTWALRGFAQRLASSTIFKVIAGAIAGLVINLKDFFSRIWTGQGALSDFEKHLHFVIATLKDMASWLGWLPGKIIDLGNEIVNFVGKIIGIPEPLKRASEALRDFFSHESPNFLSDEEVASENKRLEAKLKTLQAQKEINNVTNKFAEIFNKEFSKQIADYQRINKELITQAETTQTQIGLSEQQRDRIQAQVEVYNRYQQQVDKVNEKLRELKEAADVAGKGSTDEAKLNAFLAERGNILARITQEYSNTANKVAELTENTIRLQEAERLRLFTIEQQTELQQELTRVNDEFNKIGLTELEKKYYDVAAAANARAAAEVKAANAARGSGNELSASEEAEIYKRATAGVTELQEAIRRNHEASRTWSAGWRDAFNQFVENATNTAQQARDTFNSVVNNMGSALDKFVETGKFNFGDLARSIIQDIIKIQLRAQASRVFSSFLGGFGGGGGTGAILGTVGKLFGFANGGNPPIGKASIVGENGPELIVPRTSQTVIPNHAMGSSNTSYVTYNINAIDSQSFEQRLSQNPKLLYGITKEGERQAGVASFR